MTDPVDLDAFPSGALAEAIAEESRLLDAVAGNRPEITEPRRVGPETSAGDLILAIVYGSRSGGRGHVVTFVDTAEGRAAMCICEAVRNLHRRPAGCWAMVHGRDVAGVRQP